MNKKWMTLSLAASLSFSVIVPASAAEIWSDGDWQLGQPSNQQTQTPNQEPPSGNTTLWSEDLWKEEPLPQPTTPSQPDVEIELPEEVKGPPTMLTFPVPPIVENGRTLVPVRDILEPLGAQLQWDPIKQLVTAAKGNTTVHLIINNNMAMVNGEMVKLEAPAKIINGRTFIPLRFISQALGYKVDFDTATRKVTIDDRLYFQLGGQQTQKSAEKQKTAANPYVGNWSIWIPGGYSTTGTTVNGDGSKTITQEYVQGAKGYTLSIHSNGTYSWQTTGGTITGTWQAEADGRIVLLKGKYDFDWYVTKTKENEIKFYSYGMEEYGTKIK